MVFCTRKSETLFRYGKKEMNFGIWQTLVTLFILSMVAGLSLVTIIGQWMV